MLYNTKKQNTGWKWKKLELNLTEMWLKSRGGWENDDELPSLRLIDIILIITQIVIEGYFMTFKNHGLS